MRRTCLLLPLLLLLTAAPALASSSQESTFQDDSLLVHAPADVQRRTLDQLVSLGVDRVRASLFWRVVAPAASSNGRPPGFDGRDPAAYPPGAWDRYDRLVVEAGKRGIAVNLNPTSPAPDWATGEPSRADIDETYAPDARAFGEFVFAAARRYSGAYQGLPRVDYWSIWNEPNQGGWLTPQWVPGPRDSRTFVEASPRLYRDLVDAAYAALVLTGHGRDTILVGETAPKGLNVRGETRAMKPRRFLLRLYCLDDNAQMLRAEAATDVGCPAEPSAQGFREAHPALFAYTGYAHHPYELTQRPDRRPGDREFFTVANLGDLSALLRRIFARYGAPLPGGGARVPLYLTEFGYQTDPPDPLGVSTAQQAAYLNQSEWLTWKNASVRTLAQFLLVDDKPGSGSTPVERYGATFQSGLRTERGTRKPSYSAYRLPIHVRRPRVRRGSRLGVWGLLRSAPNGPRQRVAIEVRAGRRGRFRRVRTVRTSNARGYVLGSVVVRRSGAVRLAWRDARSGNTIRSRIVQFTVVR